MNLVFQLFYPFWQYGFYSVENLVYFIISYVLFFIYLGLFLKVTLGIFQTSEPINYRETFITSIIITTVLLIISLFIFQFVSWIITLFLAGFLIRYRHQLAYYKSVVVFFIVIMIYYLLYIIFVVNANRFFIPLGPPAYYY
jgi:hypothetical protein